MFNYIVNIIKKYKKYVRIDVSVFIFLIKFFKFLYFLVYLKLFGYRKGLKGVFIVSDI